jgi:hypothetical protein
LDLDDALEILEEAGEIDLPKGCGRDLGHDSEKEKPVWKRRQQFKKP